MIDYPYDFLNKIYIFNVPQKYNKNLPQNETLLICLDQFICFEVLYAPN